MNISLLCFVSGSFFQATSTHIFLHLGIDFMSNFAILQQGMLSCGPLLDKSIRVVSSVVALLGRRLIELFLNIGIRFIFGSLGIRAGMAGPVIAIGFRQRRETRRQTGTASLFGIVCMCCALGKD